jgi:hypothetical protein
MAEVKAKKKAIPKVMKSLCWSKHVGDTVGMTQCMCCETNQIKMNDFQCGHVVAEANGGTMTVDNLRPICKACNLSMGTENLNEFKLRCGFNRGAAGAPAPAPAAAPLAVPAPVAEPDEVFWSPGMFSRGGVVRMPKYIKWQRGTDSVQMGKELTQHGYVYNRGVYERI